MEILSKLRKGRPSINERKAVLSKFYCPLKGDYLDEGIVTYFKSPFSLTGEDIVEISVTGGFQNTLRIHRALLDTGLCRESEKV